MRINLLTVRLRLFGVDSLKERRSIVDSLIIRLRRNYNVSVAEVPTDERDLVVLVLANVSTDGAYADGVVERVLEQLQGSRDFYLEDHELEVF